MTTFRRATPLRLLGSIDQALPIPVHHPRSALKLVRFIFPLIFLGSFIAAQSQPAAEQMQDWVPDSILALRQLASSHSDFTFDHSMLVLASKADQDDDSLRRVIAGVDGVSVHRFRFQNGADYDPEVVNAVRREFHAARWEHISGGHNKQKGPGESDVWFRLENASIRKVAFMTVSPDHVNFVTISGSISPIDLLHLAGHFGIPPIEGGVKVPNTAASQPTPQQPGY
jgi:hypothetical protein